ncbi:MAG: hypothetical protein E7H36_08660 [Bifidobacterium dentium]|nr:hypothetical protein [Bifidobacterium dentium]
MGKDRNGGRGPQGLNRAARLLLVTAAVLAVTALAVWALLAVGVIPTTGVVDM